MTNLEEVEENLACGNKEIVLTKEEQIECDKIFNDLGTEFCRKYEYTQEYLYWRHIKLDMDYQNEQRIDILI